MTSELAYPEQWQGHLYSGGWRTGAGGDLAVREPATGDTLLTIAAGSPADIERAAILASTAQREWAAAPWTDRQRVLERAASLWETAGADLVPLMMRESGSTQAKARSEIHVAVGECRAAAALAAEPFGDVLRSSQADVSFSRRLPIGVVGVIAPFNFPLALAIRSVAPALAMGNAVILKPDPRTAIGGGLAIAEILDRAGLPPGLLHVVPGGREVGESVVSHAAVGLVAFTGSTAAGRSVAVRAAELHKRVHLELGGNAAYIIMADADIEAAAAAGAWGAYRHQGQICMSIGRHFVHASRVDEYIDALAARAESLTVGDPWREDVHLGPVIDRTQRDRIHRAVTDTSVAGATLVSGGTYDELFYRPTVLAGVQRGMPVYEDEVFGPVAGVTAFADADELASRIAATPSELVASVATREPMAALSALRGLRTGMLHINDQTVRDEVTAPFGGVGASGSSARFGGVQANLDAYTDLQWVTMRERLPDYQW
jgi:benzaldehyde dehydrogenase (NAD)